MNGLANEYRGDMYIQYIDIDDPGSRALVREYDASSIPLIVILDDRGQVTASFRGVTRADALRGAIDAALVQSSQTVARD